MNRPQLTLRATGVLGAVALLCAAAPIDAVSAGPLVDANVVTIGVSVPLIEYHDIAYGILHAVQIAAQHANDANTVPGITFKVRVLDDTLAGKHSAIREVANAKTFVADHTMIGAIGPLNSDLTGVVSPLYNFAQLAELSPSDTNPAATDPASRSKFEPHTAHDGTPITFFRTISSDLFQGQAAALYAYRTLKARRVYVVDNGTSYGLALAASFQAKITALGASVVGTDEVNATLFRMGTELIAQNVAGATGGPPDLVYYGGSVGPNGGAEPLLDALQAQGIHTMFMSDDGTFDARLISATHNRSAVGAYATSAGPLAAVYPQAKAFLSAEATFFPHTHVSLYDLQAYDAASALIDAYSRATQAGLFTAGAQAGPGVRAAVDLMLAATKLKGATGTVSFDRNGDIANHLFSVYRVIAVGKGESWSYAGLAPTS